MSTEILYQVYHREVYLVPFLFILYTNDICFGLENMLVL